MPDIVEGNLILLKVVETDLLPEIQMGRNPRNLVGKGFLISLILLQFRIAVHRSFFEPKCQSVWYDVLLKDTAYFINFLL